MADMIADYGQWQNVLFIVALHSRSHVWQE